MEKKIWTRPVAEVETFMANEYIAKCEDTKNTYYSFVCNAGRGKYGDAWLGGTIEPTYFLGWVTGEKIVGGTNLTQNDPGWDNWYEACGKTHYIPEAEFDATFKPGFYNSYSYEDGREAPTGSFIPVYIWTDGGTDVHCTTSLREDIQVITGNKS